MKNVYRTINYIVLCSDTYYCRGLSEWVRFVSVHVLCLVCTLRYLKRDVYVLRGGVQAPVVAGLCIKLLEDPATNTDERTREVASWNNNNPTWRLKGFRSAAESIFWLHHWIKGHYLLLSTPAVTSKPWIRLSMCSLSCQDLSYAFTDPPVTCIK